MICLIKRIKMNNKKWVDLPIKEKLAIGSACLAFLAGWTLTGIAAFVPLLLSEQGVLWILGQSLVYSASVFGIAAYFKSETIQMKRDVRQYMRKMKEEDEIADEE